MAWLYVVCFVFAAFSAFAWIKEASPAFRAIRALRTDNWGERMSYPFQFIFHALWSARLFWCDIIVTSILVSGVTVYGITIGFDFGGVIGTAMGLLISDIFSIYLLVNLNNKGDNSLEGRVASIIGR